MRRGLIRGREHEPESTQVAAVAEVPQPGPSRVFTYQNRDSAEPGPLLGMEPEDCPAFLSGYGWQIIEDLGHEELANSHIRPTGLSLEHL